MQEIPKKIHYCWFGGNILSEEVKKYIETWKKYCPDYEIIEWNESNFDVNQNQYCKEAYESKKWAFVSDYVRLKVLYDNGGIYFDTDIELCKSLDCFLEYSWFAGFESNEYISTGVIGSCKNCEIIQFILNDYERRHFLKANGNYDLTTNVVQITELLRKKYNINFNNKLQIFGDNYLLLPIDYLSAKNFFTGEILKTKNTYAIHHFAGTWRTKKELFKDKIRKVLISLFGENFVKIILKIRKRVGK